MGRVHARTAVGDRPLLIVDTEVGEPFSQLLGRLEPPVGTKVLGPGRAERARYVPSFGVDGFLLAAITLTGPGIDDRNAGELANVLEVEDARAVRFAGTEIAAGNSRFIRFEWCSPRRQTTV